MEILFKDIDFFRFKRLSTFISLIADLILVMYLNAVFSSPEIFNNSLELAIKMMAKEGQVLELPPAEKVRIFGLMIIWVRTMLISYLAAHGIVYWFYFKEKKWAQTYLKICNWIAAPSCLLFMYGLISERPALSCVFFILFLFFCWNILGQRKFLAKKAEQNTPNPV